MERKILSIIIPVYNVEKYLPECIERLVPQLNENCEVILVNDGSTDGSSLLCKTYSSIYNNFKTINQNNMGLSGARNTGIKVANGEYLLFLDSDDYLADGAIDTILKYIHNNNSDILFIRSKSFINGSNEYKDNQVDYESIDNKQTPIDIFATLNKFKCFWFAAWLVIPKRSFIIDKGIYFKEGILHEDELWVPEIFFSVQSVTMVNKCLYCYRNNREGSIIKRKNIKKQMDLFIVLDELLKNNLNDSKIKNIIYDRGASIEWGRINEYNDYAILDLDGLLIDQIKKNLYFIKRGKYYPLYYITRLIGVKKMSALLGFIKRIYI